LVFGLLVQLPLKQRLRTFTWNDVAYNRKVTGIASSHPQITQITQMEKRKTAKPGNSQQEMIKEVSSDYLAGISFSLIFMPFVPFCG